MKKITTAVVLLLVFSIVLVTFPEVRIVKADCVIYIGSDGAVEGTDKILRDGNIYTFLENISIDSSATYAITVARDNIILDGAGYALQGTGRGTGINVFNCYNVTIKSIKVRNFAYGIHMISRAGHYQSNNNTISETTITANENGMYLRSSNNVIVGNNISYNKDYGIYFSGSNNLLRNNTMDNNKYNFGVTSDPGNNDIDRSNTVNGKPICYWFDVQDRTVPSDAGYVALINCKNITVQNLQLSHNREGIILVSTTDSTITQNSITANRDEGIGLYRSSSRNVISGNYIANNGRGSEVGVWGRGIGVSCSFENQIIGNTITENNGYAIRFTGDQRDNLFYHNNFIDNKVQEGIQVSMDKIFGLGLGNEWDNGEEGNHWSDYVTRYPNATEVDSSGVGDTAFYINENNQDNYPLMELYIIPEFLSWTPLLIMLVAVVVVAVIYRRKLSKANKRGGNQ
jgi:parallel beta-helix repeat protein